MFFCQDTLSGPVNSVITNTIVFTLHCVSKNDSALVCYNFDVPRTSTHFDNVWQECYRENWQSNYDLFFHFPYVMLLHYLAKHRRIKIESFHLNVVLLIFQSLNIRCLISSNLLNASCNSYPLCCRLLKSCN